MGNNKQIRLFVFILLGVGLVSLLGAGWALFSSESPAKETAVSTPSPIVETTPTETAVLPTATKQPILKNITLVVDGVEQAITSEAETVADVLQEANIQLADGDRTNLPLDSAVEDGAQIEVMHVFPVTIEVDGRIFPSQTSYNDIPNVLASAGIALVGLDYTIPESDAVVQANDTIQVIRVSEDFHFQDTVLSYDTVYQADPELEIDNRALVSAGSPGILRQQIRTRYENGVPVSEEVDSERLAQAVVNEVISYGTNIVIRTIDTPQGPLEYWRVVRMKVTGYTASSSGKSPDHPGYGITASGLQAGKGVVAIDPQVVPFRSNVYVAGYGTAVAGDTGGAIKGRIIDLGFDDGAYETWRGQVDVYYLTPLPSPEKINYLIPTTIP